MAQSTSTKDNLQWAHFMKDLMGSLLDYSIHQIKNTLKEDHKELIVLAARNDGREYSKINELLGRFVSDVDVNLDQEYAVGFKYSSLNRFKVGLLNDLLRLTLLSDVIFERPNKKKLVVKGPVISSSGIKQYIDNSKGLEGLEEVEIFALEKVFFDRDLDFSGRKVQLTVIAPGWEVMTENKDGRMSPKIVLDGKAGAAYTKDAGNLDIPGSGGNDGEQGLPGGAAGTFLGIGMACESCGWLRISANGGQGGPGQDGGPGQKGKDGREPYNPEYEVAKDCTIWKKIWKDEGSTASCSAVRESNQGWCQDCVIDGYGKPGGNGGNGGPGGIGGNSGKASVVFQYPRSSPTISNNKGPPGNPGKGGKGGAGATKKILKMDLCSGDHEMVKWGCAASTWYEREKLQEPYPASHDGQDGPPPQESREHKANNYSINPSLAINEYKNYLRENMIANEVISATTREFLKYLEEDDDIGRLYDTIGLIKDLLGLESGPPLPMSLRKPSYQRLLSRVEKYQLRPHETKNADDFKLVLSYLYTAINSRIHDIDNEANENLVVDVRKNLAYMEGNIEEWRRFKELVGKNKIRNKYKEGIQNKIEEANAFIENEVTKDIEDNIRKTTDQLNKMYAETVKMQNAAVEEKKKLIEQKRQLERQLMVRSILGVVQIASQALSFIGPVGAAVGAVIGGATSAIEGAATSGNAGVAVTALPDAVTTTLKKLNEAYKEKQENFKKQLLAANSKMEAFLNDKDVKRDESAAKAKVSQIQAEVAITKSKLDDLVSRSSIEDPASVSEMYDLRKRIDGLLKEGKEEIGKLGGANKYKNVVEKVQNIVGLAKMGVDLYNKVQGDLDKIDGVDKSIATVNAKMTKLDAYEESIYTKMGPMIGRIKKSMESAENSEGKSHAALDVTKWQVQGSIRDVRKELQEITKGFDAGNDLIYYIDKVEYAMSMMIQMFDRIQSYGEQGDLVDVITDVDSAAEILNAELYTAVSELKLRISSNVLSEYKNTMNAVKQYVFPFATEYMKPLTLPERFNLNQTDQLVYNLKTLQKTMQREESTTLPRESHIMTGVSFRENDILPPFFVWSDQNLIRKLLEGYEVPLYADIMTSKIQENAVKFNEIWIRLKSMDPKSQGQLNKVLREVVIRMTHCGQSFYRCKDQIYTVPHQPQTIIRRWGGGGNVIYSKITHNEPVLSPFAYWNITIQSKGSLDSLKPFIGRVELVLEGKGSYVKGHAGLCNADLSNYYTLVNGGTQRRLANDLGGFREIFEKLEDYELPLPEQELPIENNNTMWTSGADTGSPVEFLKESPNNPNQASALPGEATNDVTGQVSSLGLSTLPLLEMMVRKLNGTKRTGRSLHSVQQAGGSEYAHNLAYSAYAPKLTDKIPVAVYPKLCKTKVMLQINSN